MKWFKRRCTELTKGNCKSLLLNLFFGDLRVKKALRGKAVASKGGSCVSFCHFHSCLSVFSSGVYWVSGELALFSLHHCSSHQPLTAPCIWQANVNFCGYTTLMPTPITNSQFQTPHPIHCNISQSCKVMTALEDTTVQSSLRTARINQIL